VAIKRFDVHKDFNHEASNLQLLKESITNQDHILKHLITIMHGHEHFILFPFAQLGTLFEFLHCGQDVTTGETKYDFRTRFRDIKDKELAGPMLRQCEALASALKWLHGGITLQASTTNQVRCAHLDLKPDNILIGTDPDGISIVGKWMISDFNISVINRENPNNIVSIGDWFQQATMIVSAPRDVGTYLAPEVGLNKKIGRKSDIWSFGCVFSEVLAFALERDRGVISFNEKRKGVYEVNGRKRFRRRDNYFYDTINLSTASSGLNDQFKVRDAVTDWLESTAENSRSGNDWARCWVRAISEILVVNLHDKQKPHRPDASKLEKIVAHVRHHQGNSAENQEIACPYRDGDGVPVTNPSTASNASQYPRLSSAPPIAPTTGPPLPPSWSISRSNTLDMSGGVVNQPTPARPTTSILQSHPPSQGPSHSPLMQSGTSASQERSGNPAIRRTDTFSEEELYNARFNDPPIRAPSTVDEADEPEGSGNGDRTRTQTSIGAIQNLLPDRLDPTPAPHIHRRAADRTGSGEQPRPARPEQRESTASIRPPRHAHGIFINSELPDGRRQGDSKCISDAKCKAHAAALSSSEGRVRAAFLHDKGVLVWDVDIQRGDAKQTHNLTFSQSGKLVRTGMAFAGRYLAVWGYAEERKVRAFRFSDCGTRV
jgi:serine/threonine protein kinase